MKINKWIPLEKACLVGCGVTTGWGSAVNTGEVSPGDSVVVVGIGGIGGSAIQGAKIAGARHIVVQSTSRRTRRPWPKLSERPTLLRRSTRP